MRARLTRLLLGAAFAVAALAGLAVDASARRVKLTGGTL
jgi:hypothetical protein